MPNLIYASHDFMTAYEAERVRGELLAAGANWRRAKREARKVARAGWRQAAIDRLDRLANPQYTGINHTALSWWRNPHV